MSNPYDPNQPQDPQNPYGQPQQPAAGEPPASQPDDGRQPTGQPPYDQPSGQPSYDQPTGQPPAQPYGTEPYGQQPPPPAQPYGQPPQGGYGGAYPTTYGAPGDQPAGKGMAVTSLILGIVGCAGITALISIVLGIVVLVRGKDGRNHGKGLAIAGIVLSVLWLIGLTIIGVAIGNEASKYSSIDDLSAGDCITASGLSSSGDTVSLIKKTGCSGAHDGEVLATHTLTGSEASGYGDSAASQLCQAAVSDAGKIGVVTGSVSVIGLTESITPDSGDKLACVAFNSDGSDLTGPLG